MWHRKSYTETRSRKKWHQTAVRNIAKCHHHHHLIGTGGMTQKKMKKKSVAGTISLRINMREMIPHNKRICESRLQEEDTLTPQILSPKRVRDSRPLNGDESADADTNTPYVTIQASPPTCQESRYPRKYKQNEMLCQKCPLLLEELQKAQDNVRLIEDLIEDARNIEKTQDTLDRLAMLHKHARTNYKDMANLTFALNHCQNQPQCPSQ